MPIINSEIVLQNIQIDGRSTVRELHTDDQGVNYYFDYVADKGIDTNHHLQNDAQQLNDQFQYFIDNAVQIAQEQVDILQDKLDDLQVSLVAATDVLQSAQQVVLTVDNSAPVIGVP